MVSVHAIGADVPVSTSAPFGDVTATVGCGRPSSHRMVLSAMSLRIALGLVNGGSTALSSKNWFASRLGRPAHSAVPGVPFGVALSQRSPMLSGVRLSRHVYAVGP